MFSYVYNSSGQYIARIEIFDGDAEKSYLVQAWTTVVVLDGPSSVFGPAGPKTFALEQNYPNPFNPTTHIAFEVPKSGHVMIAIYNTIGQRVATLLDKKMEKGRHVITFEAANMPSGVYFYKISVGDYTNVKKMTLLK